MGDNFTQLHPTPLPKTYLHPQFRSQGAKLSSQTSSSPPPDFLFCSSTHYYFLRPFFCRYLLILTHELLAWSKVAAYLFTQRAEDKISLQLRALTSTMDALFFQGCLCWRVIQTRPEHYLAQVFCTEEEPCVKLNACHICEQFRNHWLLVLSLRKKLNVAW